MRKISSAGNLLLKATKEASQTIKAGSEAAITGLKVGTDAAMASYNSANMNGNKSTGVVRSGNIGRISEVDEGRNLRQEQSKSVDTALARREQPVRLKEDPDGVRSRDREEDRKCRSAPSQGLIFKKKV